MIPVREFASADEMKAHYKALRARTFAKRAAPVIETAPIEPDAVPPVELEPERPAPPTLQDLLLQFREVYVVDAPDLHKTLRKRTEKREAQRLVSIVAKQHGVSVDDILGPSRDMKIYAARLAATAIVAKRLPTWSLLVLGRFFHRDHTTILSSLRKAGVRK